jgi:hypothetical protein
MPSEKKYCWDCYIKQTYVNSDGEIVNWYKQPVVNCGKTQKEIKAFEIQNSQVIDTVRMIGIFMECQNDQNKLTK